MRFSTSKTITIIIGCMVAICIGTFAPQCESPKPESSFLIPGKYLSRGDHGMARTVTIQTLSTGVY